MFNKVILIGNLTRDVELRYSSAGLAIASTAIAVTRRFSGANGEKQEETCFVDITFFGKYAEVANQYLHKGSKVMIEGRLRLDSWQDKNTGQSRQKHSVIVEGMEMLDSKNDASKNQGYNQNSGYTQQSGYSHSSNGGYSQGGYQQNQPSNGGYNRTNFNKKPEFQQEALPEIDIDADRYAKSGDEGDEDIPF
jgi:single-stranded DNA-binding protein